MQRNKKRGFRTEFERKRPNRGRSRSERGRELGQREWHQEARASRQQEVLDTRPKPTSKDVETKTENTYLGH